MGKWLQLIVRIAMLCFLFNAKVHAITIPKKFHFIWIGRDIPLQYVYNIRSFAIRNPDYRTYIWTDKSSHIQNTISKEGVGGFKYELRDIREVENLMSPKIFSFYQREKAGIFHNRAAASDFLRLFILRKEGGVYLDTDIRMKDSVFQEENDGLGEFDIPYGFGFRVFGLKLKVDEGSGHLKQSVAANNDILAAEPDSPIINGIIHDLLGRYLTVSPEVLWSDKREPGPIRFHQTLNLSGPRLIFESFKRQMIGALVSERTHRHWTIRKKLKTLLRKIRPKENPDNLEDSEMIAILGGVLTEKQESLIEVKIDGTWQIKKSSFSKFDVAEYH